MSQAGKIMSYFFTQKAGKRGVTWVVLTNYDVTNICVHTELLSDTPHIMSKHRKILQITNLANQCHTYTE